MTKEAITSEAKGRSVRATSSDIAGFVRVIEWIKAHNDLTDLTSHTLDDALLNVRAEVLRKQPRKAVTLETWLTLAIGVQPETSKRPAYSFIDVSNPEDLQSSVDIFLDSQDEDCQIEHLASFLTSVVELIESGDTQKATEDCEAVIAELFNRSSVYKYALRLYKAKGRVANMTLKDALSEYTKTEEVKENES